MISVQKLYSGVISGKDDGYCGWPTLIRSADGDLLVVCSGKRERHVCPFGRVLLFRSSDGGRTWSEAQALSSGPLDDRDAGICQTGKGTLLLNYFTSIVALTLYKNPEEMPESWRQKRREITLETLVQEHGFWMRRSPDNGKNWSNKYLIPVNSPHGPVRMNDDSLLFVGERLSPSVASLREGSRRSPEIAAARSCDDGLTWEILSSLPMLKGHSAQQCFEPYAIQMGSGRIIAMIRDHNDLSGVTTVQTESEDGGHTWTEPHVIHDGFPVHLLKLSDNRLMMTYGYRKKPFGIRLRLSADEATTWIDEQILYDEGESLDLGYPTTAAMPDGSFFTVWYEAVKEKGEIRFLRWKL